MGVAREPESATGEPAARQRAAGPPAGAHGTLLRLQRGAGNAAVAELMRRGAADRRPKPVPGRLAPPRNATSTVAAGAARIPAAPTVPAGPQTASTEAASGEAASLVGGDTGPAETTAEAPTVGLGDDELAALDQPAETPADTPVVQALADADGAPPSMDAAQAEAAANAQAEVDDASQETPEPETGGGGGGGGGAVEDAPEPERPVVAGPPEQAMAQLGGLPPGPMVASLGGVQSAVGTSVAGEQARLSAAPPQHTPLATTTVLATPASSLVPAAGAAQQAQVGRARSRNARPTPPPRPVPPPGPPATSRVATPALPAAPQTALTEAGARDLTASLGRLPTTDPGTRVTPPPPPRVALTGDADPGQVASQQSHLTGGLAQAQAEGTRDAAEPLGEDAVHPTTPAETMRAEVPAASAPPAAEQTEAPDAAVSAVAEQEHGPELRAAAGQAAGAMSGLRQQHAQQEQDQRRQSADRIAGLEQEHAEAEQAQRAGVRAEVAEQRAQWRSEQQTMVGTANAEARTAVTTAGQTVDNERRQAETEAAQHHAQGAQEAAGARRDAEQEASRHRAQAQQESGGGGFLGWVASRAQALFDRVKQGISAAFERARQAVRAAVEKAQQLATAVIERARQAAVAAIRLAGEVLTAIGDRVLAGFPALRDRFRNAIRDRVRRAEAAVNRLADGLKAGVRAAIGLLGRGLSALLSGLEAGLKAAVDGVAATVRGAINAAKAALQAVGAFMAVARDVAANPGAWLRNLGAAVMDGLRNHLWQALKTAIQQWFNDKVEQVLGLGRAVWNLLTRGGISLARIGQMAWQGIKQAIPPALIAILVEKLASMIMPAAGAVLVIIQGLQAAWGAVSRVLQAIDRFIAFLRAVKSGNGGPTFAQAVAAAAVTVVDFVSNWLLARIARGASRIGNRIRAIAQRIGAALRRVATRIGGALRRVGRRLGERFRGARDRFRAWRDRRRGRNPAERREREQDRRRRDLERAERDLPPRIRAMLGRGVSEYRLRFALLRWRLSYRLRRLAVESGGGQARVVAANSPQKTLVDRIIASQGDHINNMIRDLSESLMNHPEIRRLAADIMAQRRSGAGTAENPILVPSQYAGAAGSRDLRDMAIAGPGQPGVRQVGPGGPFNARRFGRGESYPQQEHLVLAPGGPAVREISAGSLHPGQIVVGAPVGQVGQGNYGSIRANPPGDPQRFMRAVFAIQGGRRPPDGLSAGELARATELARLSQVESARSASGLVTERLGSHLAAEDGLTWQDRYGTGQPMVEGGSGAVGRRANRELGRPATPGLGEGEGRATAADVTRFLRRELDLTSRFVQRQALLQKELFDSEDALRNYLRNHLRDHLRSVLFSHAQRAGTST